MNKHPLPKVSFAKRILSLTLAFCLLANLTAPAAARDYKTSRLNPRRPAGKQPFQRPVAPADNTRMAGIEQKVRAEIEMVWNYQGRLTDEQKRRVVEIKRALSPSDKQDPKADYKLFIEQYTQAIENEVNTQKTNIQTQLDARLQEIETRAQNAPEGVSAEELADWKTKATNEAKEWQIKSLQELQAAQKKQLANAKKVFRSSVEPVILKEREEAVKQMVADLWELKTLSLWVRDILLESAPILASLRTLDNKSFLSQDQLEWVENDYTRILNGSHNATCENADQCKKIFTALAGLGMIGNSQQATYAISEFMTAHAQSSLAVPALLNGTAALLARKEYDALDGIIHQATLKEAQLESLDLLSFVTWVDAFANINGQYLGKSSKYAQYPLTKNADENGAFGNAWEDVARLLAEEGSRNALNILRKYGVEVCKVYTDQNFKMETYIKGINCHGIKPFLVGALASGKSGADQYAPKFLSEHEGPNFNAPPTTALQAKANKQYNADMAELFRQYAATTGLTPAAALARHLFVKSMGDLNAETELALDTKLYDVYKKSASRRAPNPGYAISPYKKGSAEYNAKAVRQSRTRWFRKAAVWADVAVLVWCIYDITKWGRSIYKISKGIYSASKMARTGATVTTVTQRAMMLRKLNIAPKLRNFINIPSKIRGGMEPVVLAQAPLFTSTVKMPEIPGFVQSAGKLVAQGTRFSAETGVLGVNIQELTAASAGQLNLHQSLRLNTALNEASAAANTAFANRTRSQRFFTFNKDAKYRSYLSNALSNWSSLHGNRLPGLSAPETVRFALDVKNMPSVGIPANIQTFKAPELFKGGALQQPALRRVLFTALGYEPSAATSQYTAGLMEKALFNTNVQFANRSWLSQSWNGALGRNNRQYKNLLLDNMAAVFDADGMLFANPEQYKIYRSLAATVSNDLTLSAPGMGILSAFRGAAVKTPKTDYKEMGTAVLNSADPSVMPQELPLRVFMDKGIKGVGNTGYQRVLFTDKGSSFLFGVGNNLTKPFQPQSFKITLNAENMPSLIQAAYRAPAAQPLTLKLTPQASGPGWWTRTKDALNLRTQAFKTARAEGSTLPVGTFMRGKENIYIHDIPVFIRQADKTLSPVPLTLKADSYLGLKGVTAVLETDGSLTWLRGTEPLKDLPYFNYGLPKNQLKPFLNMVKGADQPLTLFVRSGRDKIQPLMWSTGLSLSAASSSLIPSLESNYGDQITETDKTMISLALPYLPSFAAPALSPVVKKFGALRTLQFALGISTAGLAFTAANGFRGNLDHENLPSIWPLYVSGTAIGVSSALSRASLNLLIDRMGGGGSLLKSMAFKNIGSFSLLAPQIAFSSLGWKTDFSLAFPVTGTLSAGALAWVSSSRLDAGIGRVANFMKTAKLDWKNPLTLPKTLLGNTRVMLKEGWGETWNSIRLLGTKELLLPTLAATAFTGFEASSFNKASNQLIRPKVESTSFIGGFDDKTDRKNWTSLLTSGTVVAFPLLTRFGAKPLLKAMSSPLNPAAEYQRMLMLSYGLNIGGLGLLMANGFDGFGSPGFAGIAMIGVGTANMTQSLQKLSNINIARSGYVLKRTMGMSAADAALFRQSTVTAGMTSFPVSQLGLALLPLYVSNYTDNQIKEGIETKANAPHSSLWLPMTSIIASLGLASPLIWKLPKLPAGTIGFGKGIFGSYPGAWNNIMRSEPGSYLLTPANVPAFALPSAEPPQEEQDARRDAPNAD